MAGRGPGRQRGCPLNIRKFLTRWNGILFILFIGIYLVFPALRSALVGDEAGKAPEVNQVQLLVGGLAVIWALKAIWGKFGQKKDE